MKSPFSPSLRPCVVAPRTLAGDLRRTDKQAIAFAQHLGDHAALNSKRYIWDDYPLFVIVVGLNRMVRRNGEGRR